VQGRAWASFRTRSHATAALQAINSHALTFNGMPFEATYDRQSMEVEGERRRYLSCPSKYGYLHYDDG
jgi:hypothetical protein